MYPEIGHQVKQMRVMCKNLMKLTDSQETRDLSCQVEPFHCHLQMLSLYLLVHVEHTTCNQSLTNYTVHQ